MLTTAVSRDVLAGVLGALATLLLTTLLGLVVWRVVDEVRFVRRQRLLARYRPLVDLLLTPATQAHGLERLLALPRRDRAVVADLLLSAARLQSGDVVTGLREAAGGLGLLSSWRTAAGGPQWWRRAEALRAIGLLRDPESSETLLAAMNDDHEEVRAAAVDAIGRIGDPRSAPALLARLPEESRHQRARLVEAIRRLGPSIMPLLLAHGHQHESHAATILDVIGMTGGTEAVDDVLAWTGSTQPVVRTAALRALGSIGLDDRGFYFALRGLGDSDSHARAMAARALSRCGNDAAVPYLARHLDDEWLVAAHCATALRKMGARGAAVLGERAESGGQAGDLARQMLWETGFATSSRDLSGRGISSVH